MDTGLLFVIAFALGLVLGWGHDRLRKRRIRPARNIHRDQLLRLAEGYIARNTPPDKSIVMLCSECLARAQHDMVVGVSTKESFQGHYLLLGMRVRPVSVEDCYLHLCGVA